MGSDAPGSGDLALARDLAAAGAAKLSEAYHSRAEAALTTVGTKSSSIDLVTDSDRAAEQAIVRLLAQRAPADALLAEESGLHGSARAVRRWIVDPLDGTTNFAHGLPFFCVSVALEVDGVLVAAAIDAPELGWRFAASRGQGASIGAAPLTVSTQRDLGGALLATGFPYDRHSRDTNVANFALLLRRAQGIRRCGSAALDLALVARGVFDGYWELGLKPWDLAAGALLVSEAGGRTSSLEGGPLEVHSGALCATNGLIHDQLLAALKEVRDAAS